MSKLMRSMTSSGGRYSGSMMDGGRRATYGRIGADGSFEPSSPSFVFPVPRKLRIMKLGSRRSSGKGKEPSSSFLGRIRGAYERMMFRAASKTGEFRVVPVAKADRAPPALTAVVNTWTVAPSFGSRKGAKISDLDPGFKMTAVEKKYLEHLRRSASIR